MVQIPESNIYRHYVASTAERDGTVLSQDFYYSPQNYADLFLFCLIHLAVIIAVFFLFL